MRVVRAALTTRTLLLHARPAPAGALRMRAGSPAGVYAIAASTAISLNTRRL